MSIDFHFKAGRSPLLVSFPHNGAEIPREIRSSMTRWGKSSVDTDWYVRDLYDCVDQLRASTLTARWSRYVIDLNRSAEDVPLYPGQLSTGLCPEQTFDGKAVYQNAELDRQSIEQRVVRYWQPYHDQLAAELTRIKQQHGYAILWDAHSIRGYVSSLFEGRLPDLNFGTFDQQSADDKFGHELVSVCNKRSDYHAVLNGRFKGGYITRRYGAPSSGVHAIQLEINQQIYLSDELEVPPKMDVNKSASVSALIERLLHRVLELGGQL